MTAWRASAYFLICAFSVACSRGLLAQVVPSCPVIEHPLRDLSVELSLAHGQKDFQQGEIIGLELRYSSRSKDKYLFNNRSYDRSGRLEGIDSICLQPVLGDDPLDDYFHSYAGFMGGGLFTDEQVTATPLLSELDLNEYVSLPPGEYRLSIVSDRVSLGEVKHIKRRSNAALQTQSNWVSFRVIKAEPAWQLSTLNAAAATLDSPRSTPEEKRHAARVLRFLDSENATLELVRRFWKSGREDLSWNFEAGLFGSPFRQIAIKEMHKTLRESRDGTRDWFIDVLVNLEMQADPRFRDLRYGTEFADHEIHPGQSYEAERNRRVAEYSSGVASGP